MVEVVIRRKRVRDIPRASVPSIGAWRASRPDRFDPHHHRRRAAKSALERDRFVVLRAEGIEGIAEASLLAHTLTDLDHDLRVLLQEALCVLAALTELFTLIGEPRAGLLDDRHLHTEVEQRTFTADALAVHDVELGLPERRCDLVLDDLDPSAGADH